MYKVRGLHQIAPVIVRAEGFHLSGFAIHPVWPGAMEAVRFLQPVGEFGEVRHAFLARDKTPLNAHQNGHDAKARAPRSDYALIVIRIVVIEVNTLARSSGYRLRALPEILKGIVLHECEE